MTTTEQAFWFDADGNPVAEGDPTAVAAEIVVYDADGNETDHIYGQFTDQPVPLRAQTVTFEWREEDHPRGEHGRFGDKGGDEGPSTEAKQLAGESIAEATEQEKTISPDVSAAIGAAGGTMFGYQFRLKTESSLAGKIDRDVADKTNDKDKYPNGITAEQAAAEIHDNVRYTANFTGDRYNEGLASVVGSLRAQGYEVARFKNTWMPEDSPYRGINMQLRNRDGYAFELQVHTPASAGVKMDIHRVYEAIRDLPRDDPAAVAGAHHMTDISRELVMPIGADRIHVPTS